MYDEDRISSFCMSHSRVGILLHTFVSLPAHLHHYIIKRVVVVSLHAMCVVLFIAQIIITQKTYLDFCFLRRRVANNTLK